MGASTVYAEAMRLSRKLHFSSSASFFLIVFLIALLVVPLVLVPVIVCFLGPESSSCSWFTLSSPWALKFSPLASFPASVINGSSSNEPNFNNSTFSPLDMLKDKASNEKMGVAAKTRVVKRCSKLKRLEASMVRARASIKEAALVRNLTSIHEDPDYVPRGPIYRNANAFHRSYLEMEKLFKIYVYEEGDPPMFHNGPCKSIYSTEGRFINEMEKGIFYRTKDPDQALAYFLPFSVVMMVQYLYVPESHEINGIGGVIVDYINVIANKHPFWNRSLGADHFMLSCHDWGPRASSYLPNLFNNSIRVLCNANTSEGFSPSKDVSFPEIHLLTGEIAGLLGGFSPSSRPFLAFFAGRLHGHIRFQLLKYWKNKDQDMQVYDQLPHDVSYATMLKKSRFCLCPSGYEVASPRIVEAVYAECLPVLISDGYVPPFSDVLNWRAFSVQVQVKDIPNIKRILMGISQNQYLRMHRRVKLVQRHFVVNGIPKRFDVFHMIIHSIWLRRLNLQIEDW